jgi:hypothetical protein
MTASETVSDVLVYHIYLRYTGVNTIIVGAVATGNGHDASAGRSFPGRVESAAWRLSMGLTL